MITQDVTESSQDGVVLSQAPGSGAKLSPGDRVTLTVGEFVEPEPEPDPPTNSTTSTTDSTTP